MKNLLFGSNKSKKDAATDNKTTNRNSGVFGIVTSKIAGSNRNKPAHQTIQPTTTVSTNQLMMSADAMSQPTDFDPDAWIEDGEEI